jgi:hypothetical protein
VSCCQKFLYGFICSYCHALSDCRRVLDCQLDLLLTIQLQFITLHTSQQLSLFWNCPRNSAVEYSHAESPLVTRAVPPSNTLSRLHWTHNYVDRERTTKRTPPKDSSIVAWDAYCCMTSLPERTAKKTLVASIVVLHGNGCKQASCSMHVTILYFKN